MHLWRWNLDSFVSYKKPFKMCGSHRIWGKIEASRVIPKIGRAIELEKSGLENASSLLRVRKKRLIICDSHKSHISPKSIENPNTS